MKTHHKEFRQQQQAFLQTLLEEGIMNLDDLQATLTSMLMHYTVVMGTTIRTMFKPHQCSSQFEGGHASNANLVLEPGVQNDNLAILQGNS
jgi:hypothetical protein